VYLEAMGILECPAGLLGLGSAPQQSLAIQGLLFVVLAAAGWRRPAMAVAVVLGGLVAVGAIGSVPPALPAPTQPCAAPPDICRPPFPAP